ncbi:NADPH-dependent FMN reductase [Elizabethkingia meningoseptica]|uniref:NADPH-dependent FMN reductase n=1 Tax=Elizabethkingia meningoseptica TaxID=238 RepID=UPI0020138056|nr:NADPH-dependent FMN reductase [Elizabethkingia meningoseptica]MCL1676001.1 NAD(P)H-dependent oxidoreductase [Elizabethkingia meningoseptica]MCL1686353.1 NAD(P)H-dependent oxidoreductase [Elizabethkingia meningoseptica]
MKPRILAIIGSTKQNSSNRKIVQELEKLLLPYSSFSYFDGLTTLPYFSPEQALEDTPEKVVSFRNEIEQADLIIICTPEYIFSIPGVLKNALEWCVATSVFYQKPAALITASASGEKGQEELHLIIKTLGAEFTEDSTLLIQGVKGKFNAGGELIDPETKDALKKLSQTLLNLL